MTFKRLAGSTMLINLGLVLALGAGCNRSSESVSSPSSKPHGHHGGHAVEIFEGAGVQFELTLDEPRRKMVIYVQRSDSHEPFPLTVDALEGEFKVDQKLFDVTFVADPRPDDPQGRSSRFAMSLDKLPQQLLMSNDFELLLTYSADGSSIVVTIPHRNDHTHSYHHD